MQGKLYTNLNEYIYSPEIIGKRKKICNDVFAFDIETTSFFNYRGRIYNMQEYVNIPENEKINCEVKAFMYHWTFSINKDIYYGSTWESFKIFLSKLSKICPRKKIIFVHNLAFEFQFLHSVFNFTNVIARKAHKVMSCYLADYDIEFRCTYFMSNCSLDNLSKVFSLPIKKLKGDLDYNLIRTPATMLTEKEYMYCENDVLIIYYYILEELKTYERVDKIPMTSTGHVRRELKEKVLKDYSYTSKVRRAINTNPKIYNLLQECFAGGYTHANWIYANEILADVTSYDFTSSYPYVMISEKYPSTAFKICYINKLEDLEKNFAYILVVKFKNIKSKYYNNIISKSKCRYIKAGRYDNGKIIQADELEIVLTDIDFKVFCEFYNFDEYEISESYYSKYSYLPKQFIEFILEKYIAKTNLKGVEGKEVEYAKEKNKFNALYGMSVTNTIRDNVIFDAVEGWSEEELTDENIYDKLIDEKKQGFLSFAYGVWVTAYARRNLLMNLKELDEWAVYCDTDSIKLVSGYNKKVIDDYNKSVEEKIKKVSEFLEIPFEKYCPKDKKGKSRLLGIFDYDGHYDYFITQGAKKYAYRNLHKYSGIIKDKKYIRSKKRNIFNSPKNDIHITVAGVPKKAGFKCLKYLKNFKDDLVFEYKYTNKNMLFYVEDMKPQYITDYLGNDYYVTDKSGASLMPANYTLGKSLEYVELISDSSSKRAKFKL